MFYETLSCFFLSFDWDQFVKICQHDWKEHLKISKLAKCESDLLITNKDIALQRRGTLTHSLLEILPKNAF